MDINLLRSIVTVLMLLIFIGIVFWAYGRKRRGAFDAAAQLPLIDDAPAPSVRPQAAQAPPPLEGVRKPGTGPSFSQENKHE